MSDPKPSRFSAQQSAALRRLVLDLYGDCLKRKQTLDDTCARHPSFDHNTPADRAFMMIRLKTMFRYRGAFMALIRDFSQKPTDHEAVLHLALTEALCLKTPVYAVSQWAKAASKPYARGYVHALIQHALRLGESWHEKYCRAGFLMPPWLLDRLKSDYNRETRDAIAAVHLMTPPLDLTMPHHQEIDADHPIVPWSHRHGGGVGVTEISDYDAGTWWVQDVAATLPVMLLGDVAGKTVLDLGAAPGGKTLQLCARGANVTALDYAPDRLLVLRENLARTGQEADVICADMLTWNPPHLFDAVMLDAPCSATGTIRRHPELPWIRDGSQISALKSGQMALLDRALDFLKPEGLLIYAVCSLLREEGADVVDAILAKRPDCLLRAGAKAGTMVPDFALNTNGYLQTNPSHAADKGGMDGFFAACLIKKA